MATLPTTIPELDEKQIDNATAQWSDARALSVALANFQEMETYRQGAHEGRWTNADQLYLAYAPPKTWENTRIPRSSLGVYLVNQQVEALLPTVMSALFPLEDNFEVRPRPGSTQAQARAVFDLISSQFDSLGDDGYQKLREVMRLCLKSAFIYGNGVLEIGWLYKEIERVVYARQWAPVMQQSYDIAGTPVQVPTGRRTPHTVKKMVNVTINQPLIRAIDIRDFYIDPNCPSPSIQSARFCASRHMMTIAELKAFDGQDGFSIPDDALLFLLSQNKPSTTGDIGKQAGDNARGVGNWNAASDYTRVGQDKRVEVIRYWSRERCVWLLNRKLVVFNRANDYGFLPFLNAFYIDVPGRFYGMAMADVLEGEQRFQQSALNAAVDELSITINSPWAKKRGVQLPGGSLRMAPGRVLEFEDPKNDLVKLEWPNHAWLQAGPHLAASGLRAQQITGISDLFTGAVSGQGNSANRTATGVNTQAANTSKRIQYLIENIESTLIEPLLAMVHDFNKKFVDPDKLLEVLGPEAQQIQLDPLDILNANVRFQMKASAKIQARMMYLQVLPQLLPLFLNPSFIEMMADQQQMTPDLQEIMVLIADSLNVSPTALFRKMSQEEMQMRQQQSEQAAQQSKMAIQQQRLDAQAQMKTAGNETQLLSTVYGKLLGQPEVVHAIAGTEPHEPKPASKSK